jgi:hypothetical protein
VGDGNIEARRGGRLSPSAWGACALLTVCGVLMAAVWAMPAQASSAIGYAKVSRVCPPPQPGSATCFALARVPVASSASGQAGVRPYALNAAAGPAGGLTPAELASAYGYTAAAAGGAGQTVAIVDAYDDPSIEADLATFDAQYGLPACTALNSCLQKVGQTGKATSLPAHDTTGWSVEITLDVETVHAACPACGILLVEANSATFTDLQTAVDEAVSLGATEVSNSYGGPESPGTGAEAAYSHPGVVIAAATGDSGYHSWTWLNEGFEPPARPNIPGSLPSVVSVGGTSLRLTGAGTRASEKVWNGNGPVDQRYHEGFAEGASGGGCSLLFTAQPWQQHVAGFAATGCGSKRLDADVSAVADPLTGFDIYDSYNCGTSCESFKRGRVWLTIGGTSLATPVISSLYALAGGSNGVSYPSLTLYGHVGDPASVYDVTEGGNGFCDAAPVSSCKHPDAFGALVEGYALDVDCEYTTACNAAAGYDGPSGVGAPNGLGLFKPGLPAAAIAVPGVIYAGIPATFSAGTSSDPYPGASASFLWSWGDSSAPGSGASPTHVYSAPGTYTVTLTFSDSYGFHSTVASQTVQVVSAPPPAAPAPPPVVVPGAQGVSPFQIHVNPPVPDAEMLGTALQASTTGVVKVKLSCPAGESSCMGTVTLRTFGAVVAGLAHPARARASVLTLTAGSFTVAGGMTMTVTLHLSGRARALLARTHRLRIRCTVSAHDTAGATHASQKAATLRLLPAHRRH